MVELCPPPHHPQPSIKNSNSQQLMYLFTLPDGGRRAARRRQLGRGWGPRAGSHLSRSVSSVPSREVVAPLSHLAGRAVYQSWRPQGGGVSTSQQGRDPPSKRAEMLWWQPGALTVFLTLCPGWAPSRASSEEGRQRVGWQHTAPGPGQAHRAQNLQRGLPSPETRSEMNPRPPLLPRALHMS